jgi:hypothetical protein
VQLQFHMRGPAGRATVNAGGQPGLPCQLSGSRFVGTPAERCCQAAKLLPPAVLPSNCCHHTLPACPCLPTPCPDLPCPVLQTCTRMAAPGSTTSCTSMYRHPYRSRWGLTACATLIQRCSCLQLPARLPWPALPGFLSLKQMPPLEGYMLLPTVADFAPVCCLPACCRWCWCAPARLTQTTERR